MVEIYSGDQINPSEIISTACMLLVPGQVDPEKASSTDVSGFVSEHPRHWSWNFSADWISVQKNVEMASSVAAVSYEE